MQKISPRSPTPNLFSDDDDDDDDDSVPPRPRPPPPPPPPLFDDYDSEAIEKEETERIANKEADWQAAAKSKAAAAKARAAAEADPLGYDS